MGVDGVDSGVVDLPSFSMGVLGSDFCRTVVLRVEIEVPVGVVFQVGGGRAVRPIGRFVRFRLFVHGFGFVPEANFLNLLVVFPFF